MKNFAIILPSMAKLVKIPLVMKIFRLNLMKGSEINVKSFVFAQ